MADENWTYGRMPDPHKLFRLAARGTFIGFVALIVMRVNPHHSWWGVVAVAVGLGVLSCFSITQRLVVIALGLLLFIAIVPPRYGAYLWGLG